jgi:hypothetical protein
VAVPFILIPYFSIAAEAGNLVYPRHPKQSQTILYPSLLYFIFSKNQ